LNGSGYLFDDGFGSDAILIGVSPLMAAWIGSESRGDVICPIKLVERVAERSGVGFRKGRGLDRRRFERLERPFTLGSFLIVSTARKKSGPSSVSWLRTSRMPFTPNCSASRENRVRRVMLERVEFIPVLRESLRSRKSRAGGSSIDADIMEIDDEDVRPNSF
jgi:hypothetical protein